MKVVEFALFQQTARCTVVIQPDLAACPSELGGSAAKKFKSSLKRENDDVMERKNSNKTKRIIFRLTPEEYQKIERGWKTSTLRKRSDYIRSRLNNKPVITKIRNQSIDDLLIELALLKRELNAIGNNFNQSIKKLHTLQNLPEFHHWIIGYEISKQTLVNKLDEIKKIMQKITESWLQ